MATSVSALSAKVPAGTAQAAPVTVGLALGSAFINKIRWRIPPGPRGNLGWFLAMGGVQVLPDDRGAWIVADDEYDELEVAGLPDSGAWQLVGYNTGKYDHTVYLQFYTTPIQQGGPGTTGDITAGFPATETDLLTMFTGSPSGGLIV